ncbi:hypothetical protein MSG28_013282 [Choristoneura fumiferana]|uniref:Uncharacterized protein n=1 Tax=Choristoneura fumiferana TaxID=7141 RepID=A0ACC0KTC5_CHOFU|nr:hypothetical protein MSG28_013282 [Choristoneura fumiferana]
MNINILFYLCCFVLFGFANGQVPQQMLNKLVCIEQEACGACLSAAAHCRWCADPYFSSKVPRCNDDERPAKNYPLDLYYLMDLTWSMKDDKETLVSLRDDLPSMLKNLTDNFRLGFGSFADKPVLPYINVDERRRANPCNAEEQTCGAIKKNDEQCHLDDNGYYSEYSIYDYPSLAQVYRLLDKYKVNVIFAVTERVKDHYDSIHQLMDDFTYVAKLESDSSNILKLVKMGYEDIVSVVDFEDDSNLGPVRVKYFTDCGVKGGSLIESTRCSGVEYGMTLNYEVHVTLDACPEYKKSNQTILIKESQLGQDYLTLEVEIQCGCDCEGSSSQGSSLNCPVNSHLVCGVCQCNKGWSGPSCDCSIENEAASMALVSQCRDPTSANHMPCSGAGDCLCGECECDPGFSGRYCQCKACQISRENSIECGGVGRGSCVCGQCACADGWSGDACDCTIRNDTCVAPGGTELCSGHGTCACGRCDCASSEEGSKYTGAFCETCATCENPLCAHAEPCVSCYLSKNCTDVCVISGTNYTVAEKLTDADIEDSDAVSCILRVEENSMECEYRYTYSTSTKEMVAMEIIIRAKQCSQLTSARLMTSALIIMACVVAGGIMVIMGVKSAQIVSDRRAYAKFIQEAEESRLNTQELNPLYISPISEFRLPDSFPRDKND